MSTPYWSRMGPKQFSQWLGSSGFGGLNMEIEKDGEPICAISGHGFHDIVFKVKEKGKPYALLKTAAKSSGIYDLQYTPTPHEGIKSSEKEFDV